MSSQSEIYLLITFVHTTFAKFASRGFSVAARQYVTHSLLSFTLVLHHIL